MWFLARLAWPAWGCSTLRWVSAGAFGNKTAGLGHGARSRAVAVRRGTVSLPGAAPTKSVHRTTRARGRAVTTIWNS